MSPLTSMKDLIGTWSANFTPKTVDHVVLVFKGATTSVLALFSVTGKMFEGGFNTANLERHKQWR
jgi:hypothetical protein